MGSSSAGILFGGVGKSGSWVRLCKLRFAQVSYLPGTVGPGVVEGAGVEEGAGVGEGGVAGRAGVEEVEVEEGRAGSRDISSLKLFVNS